MTEHTIQLVLSGMWLQGAVIFPAGTLVSELTGSRDLKRALVFAMVSLEDMPRRHRQMAGTAP
jgi:hypothetical protein